MEIVTVFPTLQDTTPGMKGHVSTINILFDRNPVCSNPIIGNS